MPSSNQTVLCRYHYDPLDRLASCLPAASDSIQRFYQKSRLTTEIQGQIQRSIVQSEDRLLAQQTRRADLTECALLGTDQQGSVLNTAENVPVAYTPYGTRHPLPDLPGFNGEQPDPVTGHYLLGNGYRAFNPVLMRFNSPDSLSPFGEGGINVYAYCAGDPVNRVDPTGHVFGFLRTLFRFFKWTKPTGRVGLSQTNRNVAKLPSFQVPHAKQILAPRSHLDSRLPARISQSSKENAIGEWIDTGNWNLGSKVTLPANPYGVVPDRFRRMPLGFRIENKVGGQRYAIIPAPTKKVAQIKADEIARQAGRVGVIRGQPNRDRFTGAGAYYEAY